MRRSKYKLGQKVICRARRHIDSDCFARDIEEANEEDLLYTFTIVGLNCIDNLKFDYFLLIDNYLPDNIGWVYSKEDFDSGGIFCTSDISWFYGLDTIKELSGKRGIGCYERNIIRGFDEEKIVKEIIEQKKNICSRCQSNLTSSVYSDNLFCKICGIYS